VNQGFALLSFFISADDQVTLVGTGYDTQGVWTTLTLVKSVVPTWGWKRNGVGVILKRLTSIAQRQQNFTNGSDFRTLWDEIKIQQCPTCNPEFWTSQFSAGECKWPDAQRVIVMSVDYPPCRDYFPYFDDCLSVRIYLPPQ